MWFRRAADRDRKLQAILIEQAQQREALAQLAARLDYRPLAADPGPPPEALAAALARPGCGLVHLEVYGHQFLAVTGPGEAGADAVWQRAAALALAEGRLGRLAAGHHDVAYSAYRLLPDRLRAVAVPGAGKGELLVLLSVSLPARQQQAALRKITRATLAHQDGAGGEKARDGLGLAGGGTW